MGKPKICISCDKEIIKPHKHIWFAIINEMNKNIGDMYIHTKPECLENVSDMLVEQFDSYRQTPGFVQVNVEIDDEKYVYYLLRNSLGFILGIHKDKNNQSVRDNEMYRFFEKYAAANGSIAMMEFSPITITKDHITPVISDQIPKNIVPILLSKDDVNIRPEIINDEYLKKANNAAGKLKRSLLVKKDDTTEKFYIFQEYLKNTTIRL